MKKSKILPIIALSILFLSVFIAYYINRFNKPITPPAETTNTEIITQSGVDVRMEELDTNTRIKVLVSDAERFLNTYNQLPDGTLKGQESYYNRLKPLLTDKAQKKYIDLESLKDPTNYADTSSYTADVTNSDIKVFYSFSEINSTTANVYIDCTQTVTTPTTESSYPYHFSGTFIYSKDTQTWLCNEIITNNSYSEFTY